MAATVIISSTTCTLMLYLLQLQTCRGQERLVCSRIKLSGTHNKHDYEHAYLLLNVTENNAPVYIYDEMAALYMTNDDRWSFSKITAGEDYTGTGNFLRSMFSRTMPGTVVWQERVKRSWQDVPTISVTCDTNLQIGADSTGDDRIAPGSDVDVRVILPWVMFALVFTLSVAGFITIRKWLQTRRSGSSVVPPDETSRKQATDALARTKPVQGNSGRSYHQYDEIDDDKVLPRASQIQNDYLTPPGLKDFRRPNYDDFDERSYENLSQKEQLSLKKLERKANNSNQQ